MPLAAARLCGIISLKLQAQPEWILGEYVIFSVTLLPERYEP